MCTSRALKLPSGCGMEVTPTKEPCLMSASDALTRAAIEGLSATVNFSSAPSRALITWMGPSTRSIGAAHADGRGVLGPCHGRRHDRGKTDQSQRTHEQRVRHRFLPDD